MSQSHNAEIISLASTHGYSEIAVKFGLTRQRIHQIIKKSGVTTRQDLRLRSVAADPECKVAGCPRKRILSKPMCRYHRDREARGVPVVLVRKRDIHGEVACYANGCRCAPCRRVNRERCRLAQSKRRGATPPSHGRSGYLSYACRCEVCRDAARVANAETHAAMKARNHPRWKIHTLGYCDGDTAITRCGRQGVIGQIRVGDTPTCHWCCKP